MTPLWVLMAELIEEIHNKKLFKQPLSMKVDGVLDRSRYYAYHYHYEHNSKKCHNQKNLFDKLTNEGKLKEFTMRGYKEVF